MTDKLFDEEGRRLAKCNCGLPIRYSVFADGDIVTESCNKYAACPTYDVLLADRDRLYHQTVKMKKALELIRDVNACDYEYRTWAKEGLNV